MTRTLVLGLDGATLDLIEPWARAGHLPNLARLMARGAYGQLRSVMPVLSSAAWTSFMTGTNPGKHGIYDFVQRDLATYQRHVVLGGAQLQTPTLWRLLSQAQQRVGVVNVPMTYPVENVNGVLISGLGTPEYRPFTHPPTLTDTLRKQGYRVNKTTHFAPGSEQAFLVEVYQITDTQAQTALTLLETNAWDFFMHVIRDPDEMAHFFWCYMDQTHPAYNPVAAQQFGTALLDYYRHLDNWVGKFVAAVAPETNIIIVSDHGSGPLYKDVALNEWLRQAGFLQMKSKLQPATTSKARLARLGLNRQRISRLLRANGLGRVELWLKNLLGARIDLLAASAQPELSESIDWAHTKAYSFGYHGQIYLNLRGREANGIVEPADYAAVCDEISRALYKLIDPADGQPVVSSIYRKEELFTGPNLDLAPDLTIIMRDLAYITRQGYEVAQDGQGIFATPNTHESGGHREMGILIAAGPAFAAQGRVTTPASLLDVTPTILHLHGQPIPRSMDGVVLNTWLTPAEQARPIEYAESANDVPGAVASQADLTAADEAVILKQLRSLGYVE